MRAHVLLNLLNELRNAINARLVGKESHRNKFYLSQDIIIT